MKVAAAAAISKPQSPVAQRQEDTRSVGEILKGAPALGTVAAHKTLLGTVVVPPVVIPEVDPWRQLCRLPHGRGQPAGALGGAREEVGRADQG